MANDVSLEVVPLTGGDDLGLRRALGGGMLPLLVAAMAFLAALALAGSAGASALVRHWQEGAATALTVQVPDPAQPLPRIGNGPEETRLDRALALLRDTQGVDSVHALSATELSDLLRPWLGETGAGPALPLPAVVRVRLNGNGPDLSELKSRLSEDVPGVAVESHGGWVERLEILARSLQICAWLIVALVAVVSAAVIVLATRAGLAARRDSIEIIHGLGATDAYIAGRFARRATLLAALGALAGAILSVPVLMALASFAAPFVQAAPAAYAPYAGTLRAVWTMPAELLVGLPALPVAAALIGFATAQTTVRTWLRQLP
jgi:cell division transport system permease protein